LKIKRVEASYLTNIPITPPPLLKEPSRTTALIVEVETDDGIIGYGITKDTLPWSIIEFIHREATPFLIGQDPMLTERIGYQLLREFNERGHMCTMSIQLPKSDVSSLCHDTFLHTEGTS
jgi:L-alanine-DL-glutamate epimerase-like enolase superfamily enzyme